MVTEMRTVRGTPFEYSIALDETLDELDQRVKLMRSMGKLTPQVLQRIHQFFRVRDIYNSNAIEGNRLDIGETRMVVERGFTITGKSLRDQTEATNLSQALDYFEGLVDQSKEIGETDIRQIHQLVLAGIGDDNAGKYRSVPVKITGSSFDPPEPFDIAPAMEEFSGWFKNVTGSLREVSDVSPVALSAAAHAWFEQIHPFVDGNGRTGRILMNLVLMRSGYPIGIITREDRERYYDAIAESEGSDLTPLVGLLSEAVLESLEEWEKAAEQQREMVEWTESVARQITHATRNEITNEYEIWKNAMELFKSFVRQAVGGLNVGFGGLAQAYFKDFGLIEIEKYQQLSGMISAKRTWFFRVDIRTNDKTARYLFFFGYPNLQLAERVSVTLHIAREEPSNSFNYEPLSTLTAPNVPEFVELGYLPLEERLIVKERNGAVSQMSMDRFVKEFFQQIGRYHFAN